MRLSYVREMVNDVLTDIGIGASAKKLTLRVEIADDVPARAWADALRLRQVLMNLAGNAVKFTEKGEILLRIGRTETLSVGVVGLRFEVQDTGIGIASDKLTKIFDAFEQADTSTTRRYGGTGLGLSISKRLVALLGGELWAESALGKGTTFCFTVQVASAQ